MVIAVTGFRASGKSTILTNIASVLAEESIVACVPCDWRYSSLSRFFGVNIEPEKSIGHIAKFAEPAEVLTAVPQNENLMIGGIADNEDCFAHVPPENTPIRSFLQEISFMTDYVFFECGEVQLNRLSYLAMDVADIVINVLSPTLQGIAWHSATAPLLSRCVTGKSLITVVNADRDRIYHGERDLELPFDRDVAMSADKGLPVAMDTSVSCRKYMSAIKKLAGIIQDGGVLD